MKVRFARRTLQAAFKAKRLSFRGQEREHKVLYEIEYRAHRLNKLNEAKHSTHASGGGL